MKIDGIPLDPALLRAVKELGYTEFTEIQEGCIPELQKGKDVIGQSSTGSGKTAAFGLPILEKVQRGKGIQALILTPTRELCVQVADSLASFAKYKGTKVCAVYGGVGMNPQKDALRHSEVVVATPGRLLDHMRSGNVRLDKVRFFVLDETDRMCDMGFYEDVEKIINSVPKDRQTMLFSATYTKDVDKLVAMHMKAPVTITGEKYVDPSLLEQVYYDVSQEEKFSVLVHLLQKNSNGLSLVFCGTRRQVDVVERNLEKNGLDAMAIHGGLTQNRRMSALNSLRKQHIDILVATDVAARGLDIQGVKYIYNYDVPKTPQEYIHRIGRTARAGKEGLAITILSPRDHMNFRSVLRDSSLNIRNEQTPEAEPIAFQRHSHAGHETRQHGHSHGAGTGHHMHAAHHMDADHHGRQHKPWHAGKSQQGERGNWHERGPHPQRGGHTHQARQPGHYSGQHAHGLSHEDYRDVGVQGHHGYSGGRNHGPHSGRHSGSRASGYHSHGKRRGGRY